MAIPIDDVTRGTVLFQFPQYGYGSLALPKTWPNARP
jgi:hypothetical protein